MQNSHDDSDCLYRSKLGIRNAEDALDTIRIADGYLNVRLFVEAGTLINSSTFDEYPLYGIDYLFAPILIESCEPSE